MNAKKIITLGLSAAFLVGLGLTLYISHHKHTQASIPLYQNLTVENVVDQCEEPVVMLPLSPFNFPIDGVMGNHKNCLGVDNLVIVIWNGSDSEVRKTAAKLVALMYADFQSLQNNDATITTRLLKIMPRTIEGLRKESFVAFYELTEEKIEVEPNSKNEEKL